MSTTDYDKLQRSLRARLSALANLRIVPSAIQPIQGAERFSGGFGEVHQATYAPINSKSYKHVAVKKLKLVDDFNKRVRVAVSLVREVTVWHALNHPNILKLLGFDLDELDFEHAQLVTPWQRHGHVLNYIEKTDPIYTRRLDLAIDIARGLAYLHGLSPRVYHGDVKPENVLISDSGAAQLCDFGLARVLDSPSTGLTTTVTPKMTVNYASPALAVTGTSHTCEDDVWAWACTAMVIMTGVSPYQSYTTQSTVLRAMGESVPPADVMQLPRSSFVLRRLLSQCWALEPTDRPNMQQCELRLSLYSPSASTGGIRANPPLVQDDELSLATLLANPRQVPPELRDRGEDWSAVFNPHVPRRLTVNLAHSFYHESVVSCVRFSLDGRFLATGCDTTAQVFNVDTDRRICTLTHKAIPQSESSGIRSICFSADGNKLATGAEDNLIRIWDIATRAIVRTLVGHLDAVYSLEFVRDGGLLVSGSGDATVKVWSLETDSHRTLSVAEIEADEAGIASITISADGKHIATGHMDSIVRIWNLATGDLVESLQGHSDSVYGVAFTSDNKGLVSGGLDNTVKYWNIGPVLCRPFNSAPGPAEKRPLSDEDRDKADGSSLLLSKSESHVLSVAASPDSAWVAAGTADFGIQFCDPVTGLVQFILKGHRNTVTDVDFSPVMDRSGGLLASGSGDCTVNVCE